MRLNILPLPLVIMRINITHFDLNIIELDEHNPKSELGLNHHLVHLIEKLI